MRTEINVLTGEAVTDPAWIGEAAAPTIDDYRVAIQRHIDATANERGYDSGVTCASYAGSTVAPWAAEASAFVGWRDAVWAYAYAELAKVQDGLRDQPSVAEIVAELPAIGWPTARRLFLRSLPINRVLADRLCPVDVAPASN